MDLREINIIILAGVGVDKSKCRGLKICVSSGDRSHRCYLSYTSTYIRSFFRRTVGDMENGRINQPMDKVPEGGSACYFLSYTSTYIRNFFRRTIGVMENWEGLISLFLSNRTKQQMKMKMGTKFPKEGTCWPGVLIWKTRFWE